MSPTTSSKPESSPSPAEPTGADTLLDRIREVAESRDPAAMAEFLKELFLAATFWIDLTFILGSLTLAWILTRALLRAWNAGRLPYLRRLVARIPERNRVGPFRIVLVPVLWISVLLANQFDYVCVLLRLFAIILTLFVCLHLPARFFKPRFWMRFVTTAIFAIAVLHIVGLLDNVTAFLEGLALDMGNVSVSVLDLLKGLLTFIILFWTAGIGSQLTASRIDQVTEMAPSVRVLFAKSIQITLYVIVFLVTLGVMGINITALAVFGGALGLGLGFGLQKVVSNLVSGVILLLDKSIKPGDVIEVEGTYGWINSLRMRYASVVTRDNKEILIPNEDLITNQVVNWSYSSKLVRVTAPVGISYGSDVKKAIRVAEEAASSIERVQPNPPPACRLIGFGDSSVDLSIRFWIVDPTNGVNKVRSEVLLEIWDRFHEEGIEFPFPQRDLHIKGNVDVLKQLRSQ